MDNAAPVPSGLAWALQPALATAARNTVGAAAAARTVELDASQATVPATNCLLREPAIKAC